MKIEHEYTNEIVCPYCGYEFNDSWEFNRDESGETDCPECDRKFKYSVNITVDYSTSKMNCKEIKEEHEYEIDRYYKRNRKYLGNDKWEDLSEEQVQYKKIEICKKCDNEEFIEITKEEFHSVPKEKRLE